MAQTKLEKAKIPSHKNSATIGSYLLDRLHHYGVKHIFGIPGDYVLKFDKLIEEQKNIQFINATQENNAGYMADAYARLCGLGVACITYGVGISITNSLSQAFVESSPLVVISGAAGTQDYLKGIRLHHLINKSLTDRADTTQLSIFKQVTIAQAVLDNPKTAATQIDQALALCLEKKKPIYIEIPRDMVNSPMTPLPSPSQIKNNSPSTSQLTQALREIQHILKTCQRPVLWIGHEIQRHGFAEPLIAFAERYHIPIVSSLLGKTAIDERHPLFVGVYQGKMSRPEVEAFMESRDCAFMLGLMLTDVDTGIFTAKLDHKHKVVANIDAIEIGNKNYPGIKFSSFMQMLPTLDVSVSFDNSTVLNKKSPSVFIPAAHAKTTTKRIFECLQSNLPQDAIVIADVGDALFASADLCLSKNSFLACAHFGSLGFATPGCIGAQLAAPQRRVIALVGDGAFQMTSMELSTAVRYHLDPVIIVLNNHGYGTERPLLEGSYNDILDWDYTAIPKVLKGGIGIKASTEEEFDKALKTALSHRGTFYLIEVQLDKTDFSPALRRFGELQNQKN